MLVPVVHRGIADEDDVRELVVDLVDAWLGQGSFLRREVYSNRCDRLSPRDGVTGEVSKSHHGEGPSAPAENTCHQEGQ